MPHTPLSNGCSVYTGENPAGLSLAAHMISLWRSYSAECPSAIKEQLNQNLWSQGPAFNPHRGSEHGHREMAREQRPWRQSRWETAGAWARVARILRRPSPGVLSGLDPHVEAESPARTL